MTARTTHAASDAIASLTSGSEFDFGGDTYVVQNGNRSWSLSSPESHTLRFQVSSGDSWQWDAEGRERSEIAGSTHYVAGETVTVEYGFMIEPGPENTAMGDTAEGGYTWLAIGQFHSISLDGCPPFDVELVGEKLAFNVSYQEDGDKQPSNNNYIFVDDTDITRGHYYDIKIQTNLQNDEGGFAKVWVDGELVVDYSGPVGDGTACYWKEGIYRTAAAEMIAVNYKNLAISQGDEGQIAGVTAKGQVFVGTASRDIHEGAEATQIGNAGSDELAASRAGTNYKISGGRGNDDLAGQDGHDSLSGGRGNDSLTGSSGNDVLRGGHGKDHFDFIGNFGEDVVRDFQSGRDHVLFTGTPFDSFDEIMPYMSKHSGGTMITVDSDTSLLLANVKLAKLDSGDFIFA